METDLDIVKVVAGDTITDVEKDAVAVLSEFFVDNPHTDEESYRNHRFFDAHDGPATVFVGYAAATAVSSMVTIDRNIQVGAQSIASTEILLAATRPSCQRRGFGRQLAEEVAIDAISRNRQLLFLAPEMNEINFWKNQGYAYTSINILALGRAASYMLQPLTGTLQRQLIAAQQ